MLISNYCNCSQLNLKLRDFSDLIKFSITSINKHSLTINDVCAKISSQHTQTGFSLIFSEILLVNIGTSIYLISRIFLIKSLDARPSRNLEKNACDSIKLIIKSQSFSFLNWNESNIRWYWTFQMREKSAEILSREIK